MTGITVEAAIMAHCKCQDIEYLMENTGHISDSLINGQCANLAN